MKKLLVLSLLFFSACTDEHNAMRVLQENGYRNVQLTGYGWFACSKDDTFRTSFIAISPNGSQVKGTVCSGFIFKNSTIRFK